MDKKITKVTVLDFISIIDIFSSALECRLECDPGFESTLPPVTTCVGGLFWPLPMHAFRCETAIALLVSKKGEMEVFGEDKQCSRLMKNIPAFDRKEEDLSPSVSLLDDLLVVGPVGPVSVTSWQYFVLKNPRKGILANSWTARKSYGKEPKEHLSFVHRKSLVFLGGHTDIQTTMRNAQPQDTYWDEFSLNWKVLAQRIPQDACVVKADQDTFYILGGQFEGAHRNEIFKVDMTDQSAEEIAKLSISRSQHACALLLIDGKKFILITGGKFDQAEEKDELLDLEDLTLSNLNPMMNPRSEHRMVNIGDKLFSFGGQAKEDNTMLNSIEIFNADTRSWKTHTEKLLSAATSSLAFTSLPLSAVSCSKNCKCGLPPISRRILGGQDAKVTKRQFVVISFFSFRLIILGWASYLQMERT